jgi:hypothetical protein
MRERVDIHQGFSTHDQWATCDPPVSLCGQRTVSVCFIHFEGKRITPYGCLLHVCLSRVSREEDMMMQSISDHASYSFSHIENGYTDFREICYDPHIIGSYYKFVFLTINSR